MDETLYLDDLGVFERADLLRRFCEATALAIFPGRRIGRLADGYEASFLVLEADPLADFSAIKKIRLRVKQGYRLPQPGLDLARGLAAFRHVDAIVTGNLPHFPTDCDCGVRVVSPALCYLSASTSSIASAGDDQRSTDQSYRHYP